MNIVGYHGTLGTCAEQIINLNNFVESKSDEDWLGCGVYFYDTFENAIEHNMKEYRISKSKVPTYNQLTNEYSIILTEIICDEDKIIDLNKYISKYKYIWCCNQIIDRIKEKEKYKNLCEKNQSLDGYVINFIRENTNYFDDCKIIINIFRRIFETKKKIIKSRIAYDIAQVYFCIYDKSCIKGMKIIDNNYKSEYDVVNDLCFYMNGDG